MKPVSHVLCSAILIGACTSSGADSEQTSKATSLSPIVDEKNIQDIRLDRQGLHLGYPKVRELVDSQQWPWRAIGQVNVAASHYCSGVLIAPNKVLTVAHCLWDAYRDAWYKPGDIHFVAAYSRGQYMAYSRIRSFQAAGKFNEQGQIDLDTVSTDWAILELRQNVGYNVGYLALDKNTSIKSGALVTLAGYRRDRPEVLTAQRNCKILAWNNEGSSFDHNCEIIQGDSGGPILKKIGGRWKVLGVQSLEATAADKRWGVAVASKSLPLQSLNTTKPYHRKTLTKY